jgi:hypothetical protein
MELDVNSFAQDGPYSKCSLDLARRSIWSNKRKIKPWPPSVLRPNDRGKALRTIVLVQRITYLIIFPEFAEGRLSALPTDHHKVIPKLKVVEGQEWIYWAKDVRSQS